ncbi:anti-virulence regulator CigR family protein [Halomonas sp. M5N1S17]|uniref:anti-virulence regulator CigR family protein n=1 Tax=Halomonas alkalisoli TaxID=2907158 RepID=UPI001F2FAA79|nr:anti-virulence regulator CigR family protein [Halomonas alkalisoli]MCE9662555.1 anti-virulence regulator CigR family protein [Halomonas alkalisoli]
MKTRNGLTIIAAATLSLALASAQLQAQPVEPRGQGQGQGQGQGNSQRGQGQEHRKEHRQEHRQGRGQAGERRQQAAEEGERREWRRDGESRREGRGDWERERRSGSDGYRDRRSGSDGYRDGPRIDEREIRRFFGERREWIEVDRSRDSLPPGIRMNLERGKPLPPGIAKQFDGRLARDLPRYEGYEWRRVGPDVVLVDMVNDVVYEVLRDILY